jgi:hypothetical protein
LKYNDPSLWSHKKKVCWSAVVYLLMLLNEVGFEL